MGKPLELSDMPALSSQMHSGLRVLEKSLQHELSLCCDGYTLRDPEAAFEYVRTYAVDFFDHYFEFYSGFPEYQQHWRPASERFAYQRVVKCIENCSPVHDFFLNHPDRRTRVQRTISDHAQREAPELSPVLLTGKQAALSALAGIGLASSPPLLAAYAAAQRSKEVGRSAVGSKGVFAPIPKARIPRSIQSEKAARKLEAYLDRKGLNQTQFARQINVNEKTLYRFRTTGKVGKTAAQLIAEGMSMTLEQFLT